MTPSSRLVFGGPLDQRPSLVTTPSHHGEQDYMRPITFALKNTLRFYVGFALIVIADIAAIGFFFLRNRSRLTDVVALGGVLLLTYLVVFVLYRNYYTAKVVSLSELGIDVHTIFFRKININWSEIEVIRTLYREETDATGGRVRAFGLFRRGSPRIQVVLNDRLPDFDQILDQICVRSGKIPTENITWFTSFLWAP
jgi:hypothetical protein